MVQPEVIIEQGTLRGSTGTDIHGGTFFKFQGIPYAKPPTGKLRFKAPEPPEKWLGVFDASKEGDACYSKDFIKNGAIDGSENCLILNVFTKKLHTNDLRPVLFYIHGGGFVNGSSKEENCGPDFLITENVVLVTINYRLGMLGFLSFDDPTLEASGNNGFKDAVMALKWVQKNISKFGGDPHNVTIFGISAGGAIVHLLMLSPMGKGLFHKAIAQSGTALNWWVRGTKSCKLVATAMNLEGADDITVYNALMKKTAGELYEIQEKISDDFLPARLRPFGLVLETNSKEPFLEEEPIKLILSGKFHHVPFILGYASAEGMLFEILRKPGDTSISCEDFILWFFGYHYGTPEATSVAEKIKEFYFGNEENPVGNKIKLNSDCQFIYGIYLTALTQFRISQAPTFFYRISIETNLNFFKKLASLELPGTCHGDEVGYLFKNFTTPEIKAGSSEDISLRKFVKLWSNFAKFGNPTPEENELLKTVWKPVTGLNVDFLDIGIDLVMKSNPDAERMSFWTNLFAESPAGT